MPRRRRRGIPVLAFLLALPLLFAGLFWQLERRKPIPVRVVEVTRGRVEEIVSSVSAGTIRSARGADLAPEVPGIVSKVLRAEGDRIREGDPILSVALTEVEASLKVARTEQDTFGRRLDAERTKAAAARRTRDRMEALVKTGAAPSERLEDAKDALDLASADVRLAEAAAAEAAARAEALEVQIARGTIKAPFDGTITWLSVEPGEAIAPMKPVARLEDLTRLEVRAPVDEVDLPRVAAGLPVRIGIDALGEEPLPGRVRSIAPVLTTTHENNRTAEVRVDFETPPPSLRAGMSAQIEIVRGSTETLWIPSQVVREDRDGGDPYVFVAADGRAVRRIFQRGVSNWKKTQISSGLLERDRVVVPADGHGEILLRDGARIRIAAAGAGPR